MKYVKLTQQPGGIEGWQQFYSLPAGIRLKKYFKKLCNGVLRIRPFFGRIRQFLTYLINNVTRSSVSTSTRSFLNVLMTHGARVFSLTYSFLHTTASTASTRNSSSSICLSNTRVRYFRWLATKNSIAAHGTFRCRSKLIRWMMIGAAVSGRPHHSNDRKSNVGMKCFIASVGCRAKWPCLSVVRETPPATHPRDSRCESTSNHT